MSAIPLTFPVLAFGPDVGRYARPGREKLECFLAAEDFSSCPAWDLKRGARSGMWLVDAAGRSWRVERVHDLGPSGGWGERLLRWALQQSYRVVAYDLAAQPPLPMDEVKARVCASIAANPDDWRDDEAIAGEDGPPRDEQEMLQELQDGVRRARSLPQIINALWDEDLEG